MSKRLLFLRNHKIESIEQLDQMVMQQVAKRDALFTSIQQSEKCLAEVLTAQKQAYAEYCQVKNESQELLIAQRNIASLYDAERKEEEQKR